MKPIVGFLAILGVIAVSVPLGYFLYRLINHICTCRDAAGKIMFKQFRTLYSINDDPWILNTDSVEYYDDKIGCIYLCFSFLDEIRYMAWRRRKKRLKEKNDKNKYFQIALNDMQKDIEKYQERNGL